ncbi:MAG: TAXI family TRAP transporter solute-binding subunit [Rhodospirillales bacterium]
MRSATTLVLAAMLGIGIALAPAAPVQAEDKRVFITIGTGGPTGVYFAAGNAICRLIHKEAAEGRKEGRPHGIRCAAPATDGSKDNIEQVANGELDFGIAQSDLQYHAHKGDRPEAIEPVASLRSVFSIHAEPFQLIVGKDSGIASFADLRGKRVNIGNPGSGQRGTMEVLMKAHGMGPGDFRMATEMTSSEQANALCGGDIDAFGYSVGVPNAGVAVATDGCGARIIPLDGEVERELVAASPFYAFITIPAGTYSTTDADVTTFGVVATLITSADAEDQVVYELTRAVMENIEDFRQLHPAFTNLEPKRMVTDGLTAPIHPGALRYYKEKGLL